MPLSDAEKLQRLKDWVLSRIDEITPAGTTIEPPVGTLEIEIEEAARRILLAVRKELVYLVSESGKDLAFEVEEDAGYSTIKIPETYLRFIRLKLDSWKRPVDLLTDIDSNRYRQQANKFMRATPQRPEAFMAPHPDGEGKRVIECYPDGESIKEFTYIKRIPAIKMPDELQDAMVWLAAANCLAILRRGDLANTALQKMQMSTQGLDMGVITDRMPAPQEDS